jgi:hypothetical protein
MFRRKPRIKPQKSVLYNNTYYLSMICKGVQQTPFSSCHFFRRFFLKSRDYDGICIPLRMKNTKRMHGGALPFLFGSFFLHLPKFRNIPGINGGIIIYRKNATIRLSRSSLSYLSGVTMALCRDSLR